MPFKAPSASYVGKDGKKHRCLNVADMVTAIEAYQQFIKDGDACEDLEIMRRRVYTYGNIGITFKIPKSELLCQNFQN